MALLRILLRSSCAGTELVANTDSDGSAVNRVVDPIVDAKLFREERSDWDKTMAMGIWR